MLLWLCVSLASCSTVMWLYIMLDDGDAQSIQGTLQAPAVMNNQFQ